MPVLYEWGKMYGSRHQEDKSSSLPPIGGIGVADIEPTDRSTVVRECSPSACPDCQPGKGGGGDRREQKVPRLL